MSKVLEPNNVNQLEGGHAGKLATLASEEVLASRYHRTQLWPICNNPVLDAQMTARGFQGTQRSAHKMPNSVSLLQRNQCDLCFSNANAGRWPAVLPKLNMLPACFTRLSIIPACWGSSLRSWEQRAFVGDPTKALC